jgi:hypothetical protein
MPGEARGEDIGNRDEGTDVYCKMHCLFMGHMIHCVDLLVFVFLFALSLHP